MEPTKIPIELVEQAIEDIVKVDRVDAYRIGEKSHEAILVLADYIAEREPPGGLYMIGYREVGHDGEPGPLKFTNNRQTIIGIRNAVESMCIWLYKARRDSDKNRMIRYDMILVRVGQAAASGRITL